MNQQHQSNQIVQEESPSYPAEYNFTDRELAFFAPQVEQLNRLAALMNNAASLVAMQQSLPGRWMMKPDGSGLIRVPEGEIV